MDDLHPQFFQHLANNHQYSKVSLGQATSEQKHRNQTSPLTLPKERTAASYLLSSSLSLPLPIASDSLLAFITLPLRELTDLLLLVAAPLLEYLCGLPDPRAERAWTAPIVL
jgi:hypothetical protein